MVWTIQAIAVAHTKDKLLVFLQHVGFRLIVCFSHNVDTPDSFENRLLASYLDLTTDSSPPLSETAATEGILAAVQEAWVDGPHNPNDLHAASILYITTIDGKLAGDLVRASEEFDRFLSILSPLHQILGTDDRPEESSTIDIDDIVSLQPLSGRGSCIKVSVRSDHMVYKGISFFKFLACGSEAFVHHLEACYREIRMINCIIPPHPNIISPPKAFVTLNSRFGNPKARLICGTLYPYYQHGSLASLIDRSVREKTRIPRSRKVKWCYQLCFAIHHVHFQARAWHQDIKPPNILLDEDDNLLIIDWEQCGANSFVLAPEADGSFDVTTSSDDDGSGCSRLVYTRYEGPLRVSNPIGTPRWNVFPTWNDENPKAVELAEVYSLGSTMWLLLEQVPLNGDDREDYGSRTIHWTDASRDIPQNWKDTVAACVGKDPNERIGMKELLGFWETESRNFEAISSAIS